MPAVFVALIVVVFLTFALGVVLAGTRLMRAEADKVRAARTVKSGTAKR